MKVKTDFGGLEYITAGKEYRIVGKLNDTKTGGVIIDDDGDKIDILFDRCKQIEDHSWEVIE